MRCYYLTYSCLGSEKKWNRKNPPTDNSWQTGGRLRTRQSGIVHANETPCQSKAKQTTRRLIAHQILYVKMAATRITQWPDNDQDEGNIMGFCNALDAPITENVQLRTHHSLYDYWRLSDPAVNARRHMFHDVNRIRLSHDCGRNLLKAQ